MYTFLTVEQLEDFDKALEDKEAQIRVLLERVQQLEAGTRQPAGAVPLATATAPITQIHTTNLGRRGKAPPVDHFTGKEPDLTFDD